MHPKYRHELKFEINPTDCLILRQRLNAVMRPDPHAVNGYYEIRSLYFDNLFDEALLEKINGVGKRDKFRIRYYLEDTDLIRLEKKSKRHDLCLKTTEPMTEEQVKAILNGDTGWMPESGIPLFIELYSKMKARGLRPSTIVQYRREPFIFGPGNVRVTIDSKLRTGIRNADFLDPQSITLPVRDAPIILEVKWDEFLPDVIRSAVNIPFRRAGAFSKYAACRIYG